MQRLKLAEYVAALHKLAKNCTFRAIGGIVNAAVQNHLLTEPKLTFTKAVTIAQVVELAEKGSRELQPTPVRNPLKTFTSFHI